jgi:hypothetical protein
MTYPHDDPDQIANELAAMQEDFASAPTPAGGSREKVPDGTYQAKVKNASVKRSKKSGRLMLEWWLTILGPTCAGVDVPRWNHFHSRDHLAYLREDLQVLGLENVVLARLEAILPEVLDRIVEITVNTKNGFQGIYFERLVQRNPDVPDSETPF